MLAYDPMLPYFCGHDHRCFTDKHFALMTAIKNVEEHYVVVGLLEHLNTTLAVLEHFLPQYFKNAQVVFDKSPAFVQHRHESFWEMPVSDDSKRFMARNLVQEMQFYEYLKNRLFRQFDSINAI